MAEPISEPQILIPKRKYKDHQEELDDTIARLFDSEESDSDEKAEKQGNLYEKLKRKWEEAERKREEALQVMKQPEPIPICTPYKPKVEWIMNCKTCWTCTPIRTPFMPKTDLIVHCMTCKSCTPGKPEWIPMEKYNYSTRTEVFDAIIADCIAEQRKIAAERKRRAEKQGKNDSLSPKPEESQGINNSVSHTPEVINLVDDDEDENLFKRSKPLFTKSTTSPKVITMVDDDESDDF